MQLASNAGQKAHRDGIVPKVISGVSSFVERTQCNGSGVVVAILDTGVDPGAAGLSRTPDGRPKVIDLVDCTGSGDVIMSSIVKPKPEDDFITGLSGRKLVLTDSIRERNPSGTYRLGIKSGYQLLPRLLVKRLKKERRDAWDEQHRIRLNAVHRRLNELRLSSSSRTRCSGGPPKVDSGKKASNIPAMSISLPTGLDGQAAERDSSAVELMVEDLEAQEAALLAAEKDYSDPGPVYDCIVFYDGQKHLAIVDTGETGKLSSCVVLESYHVQCKYATMHDLVNYAVNIYDDGEVLSIVVDGGAHGTHVAGIVAGYFPDAEDSSGVAPGAQIVSLKIGDSRLSSMETHQGLSRALGYLLQHTKDPNCLESSLEAPNKKLRASTPVNKDPMEKGDSIVHSGSTHTRIDTAMLDCPIVHSNAGMPTEDCVSVLDSEDPGEKIRFSRPGCSGSLAVDTNISATATLSTGSSRDASPAQGGFSIDVVNMSFGEPCRYPDHGRFVELVTKLVRERNVSFLCSAGNNGPALSTVSAPGGTTDALMGVGAYVTPEMLKEAYSMLNEDIKAANVDDMTNAPHEPARAETQKMTVRLNGATDSNHDARGGDAERASDAPVVCDSIRKTVIGMPYTWTSRGPCMDGGTGVSICAPGGAIASVPVWSLSRKKIMNGTSMASPSAAGCIALLVSYLKSRGMSYTSNRVRMAVESSARPLALAQMAPSERIAHESDLITHGGSDSCDIIDRPHDIKFSSGHGAIDVYGAYLLLAKQRDVGPIDSTAVANNGDEKNNLRKMVSSAGMNKSDSHPDFDWRYHVSVEGSTRTVSRRHPSLCGPGILGGTRGLYLRGREETNRPHRASVKVEAVRDDRKETTEGKKALAAMEIVLSLETSCDWIRAPSSVVLYGGGRSFPISVDPTGLVAGRAHHGVVSGFVKRDALDFPRSLKATAAFHVPVTVVKPSVASTKGSPTGCIIEHIRFSAGAVMRRFYEVPQGSSYAVLRITAGSNFEIPLLTTGKCFESGSIIEAEQLSEPGNGRSHVGSISAMSKPVSKSWGVEEQCSRKYTIHTAGENARRSHSAEVPQNPVSRNIDPSRPYAAACSDRRNFDVHVVHVEPRKSFKQLESRQSMSLLPGVTKEFVVEVQSGATMELCIAQRWSSPGLSELERVQLTFCGLRPEPNVLHSKPGSLCFPRLDVCSCTSHYDSTGESGHGGSVSRLNSNVNSGFLPSASLVSLERPVSPTHTRITPLSPDRDMLPGHRLVSQLVLEYKFEVFESSCAVRLRFAGLNGSVYEADIEGGPFVTVHDVSRQLMFCSDIYPCEKSLPRGTYVVRAALRHDKISTLEKLRELRCIVVYKLSAITLEWFDTAQGAALGLEGKACRSRESRIILEHGEKRTVFFATPKKTSIPRWAQLGDTLVGTFSVDEPLFPSVVDSKPATGVPKYPLSMSLAPGLVHSSKSTAEKLDDQKGGSSYRTGLALSASSELSPSQSDDERWIQNLVRSLKMKALKTYLKESKLSEFIRLSKHMDEFHASDSAYLALKLQMADIKLFTAGCNLEGVPLGSDSENLSTMRTRIEPVVDAADALLSALDTKKIAAHFGTRIDNECPKEVAARKEFEGMRSMVVMAMFRKARALSFSVEIQNQALALRHDGQSSPDSQFINADTTSRKAESFFEAYQDLSRWVKIDGKHSPEDSNLYGEPGLPGSVNALEFACLAVRRELLRQRPGLALKITDGFLGGNPNQPSPSAMHRMRLTILNLLGWTHMAQTEERHVLLRFPPGWEPF